ncbi:hypothetical protein N7530_007283 [Penicillium desertorum]|uniref:Alkaline phytoceramidase n=1 Tax=Penicillium desertorum TaxID=1303715 RepID=A0A9X0BJT1_9EURO|nr:hypothetical protein N7530_007283 [Penicillium desertorum]
MNVNSADYFWGSPNSKANYCETDYAVSRYIAEFINSLTNVVYIIYGIYGLRQLRREDKYGDSLRALPYWGLIAVGLCSFAFHLSLKYHTQMITFHVITDELVLHSVSFVGAVTLIGVHTIRLVNSRTLPGSVTRRQIWGIQFSILGIGFGYLTNGPADS